MGDIEEKDDEIWIQPITKNRKGKDIHMAMTFQVADVAKPLMSVKRIAEKGNVVSFGPTSEDNFIVNKDSGDKLMLRPNGRGSYLMDVVFEDGTKSSITVDSGAEENVCPWGWGQQHGINPNVKRMGFRNASGGYVAHWGQREVKVRSPF